MRRREKLPVLLGCYRCGAVQCQVLLRLLQGLLQRDNVLQGEHRGPLCVRGPPHKALRRKASRPEGLGSAGRAQEGQKDQGAQEEPIKSREGQGAQEEQGRQMSPEGPLRP